MYQRKIPARIFSIIGLLAGVMFLIFGILTASGEFVDVGYGGYLTTNTYGADYYTDSYEAFVYIFNRICSIGYAIEDLGFVLGLAMITTGLVVIAVFGNKLSSTFPPKAAAVYEPQFGGMPQQPVQAAYQQTAAPQRPAAPVYQQPVAPQRPAAPV